MSSYYCPQCGENFESSECLDEGGILRCPNCIRPRVLVRGRILVAVGLILLMASTQIFPPYVPALGILVGGGLCIMGFIRGIRRRRVRVAEEDALDDWEE